LWFGPIIDNVTLTQRFIVTHKVLYNVNYYSNNASSARFTTRSTYLYNSLPSYLHTGSYQHRLPLRLLQAQTVTTNTENLLHTIISETTNSMPSLNDLPAELITPICGNLHHADIVSLRHTSRALATGSADGFRDASLDSITVTCSKAGLERLEFLMTTNAPAYVNVPERVNQINHVTINVLTPSRLKELADTCMIV
jgi:hypothetical protein